MKKRLYSMEFQGIWPVGAVAIAIAENKEQAAGFFLEAVNEAVSPDSRVIDMDNIVEIPFELGATVLLNGDY